MKTIAINGSNGFLGQQICNYFENKYHIRKIIRDDYGLNPADLAVFLEGSDIIINLAGARISFFATAKYRKLIYKSRILTTRNLIDSVNVMKRKPSLFISFSAIGIYDFEHFHDEQSAYLGNDFLAHLCKDWEGEVNRLVDTNFLIVRVGIVLAKTGGVLPQMVLPFRFGFGSIFGKGDQPFSFIHIRDFLAALEYSIDHHLTGIINFVAPNFCTNLELSRALSRTLHRPLLFRIPSFLIKMVMGSESSMLLQGQRVMPKVLIDQDFKFDFPEISGAINHLLKENESY